MIIPFSPAVGMAQPYQASRPIHQPEPQGPVNLRVRVTREEHQVLRHLAVDTERPLGDLLHEGVERLITYYQASGFEQARINREEACDD